VKIDMTKEQVELELRLHMTNLCLAVLSKRDGMLRECKELLVDKVCELIASARKSDVNG
jgi:hypothetical protein